MKNYLFILCLAFIYGTNIRLFAATSILPEHAGIFRSNKRAEVKKAVDGTPGFIISMSGDKFAEVSWKPLCTAKITNISIKLQALNLMQGKIFLKLIDAEGEQYGTKRISIAKLLTLQTLNWEISDFKRCHWSKKKSGVVTIPIKTLMLVFIPRPKDKGKVLKINLQECHLDYSIKKEIWVDRFNQLESKWILRKVKGAEGSLIKNSDNSYTFAKTNGKGYIELRLKKPVELKGNRKYFFRGSFQSFKSGLSSFLLFRFPHSMQSPPTYNSSGDFGKSLSTDSLIENCSKGEWIRRHASIKLKKDHKIYPSIVLIGNPATVKLKNLQLDTIPIIRQVIKPAKENEIKFSSKQVEAILKKRQNATLCIAATPQGPQLKLNGKLQAPCFLKCQRNPLFLHNEDFIHAGVKFISVQIPVSYELNKPSICLAKGKYNWKLLDKLIIRSLRRTPDAYLLVNIATYQPWKGWSKNNYNELWQNSKGERALGNNCHLKVFSNNLKNVTYSGWIEWWPSYSSEKWQNDMNIVIRDVMKYISSKDYGKTVVGIMFNGGGDGQYQYRKDDFSQPAQKAFKIYLKQKYSSINALNKSWKTSYDGFDSIQIPETSRSKSTPKPFLAPGVEVEYAMFQTWQGWTLREQFAKAGKEGIGKDIITIFYGQPDSFNPDFHNLIPSVDAITQVTAYPYRNNRVPYGIRPPAQGFKNYKKLFINELDLRSWNTTSGDEFIDRWQACHKNIEEWENAHRKLVGLSFATDSGWWYYSMTYLRGRFFDDPLIMKEISKTIKIYYKLKKLKPNRLKADVCIVRDISNDFYIRARPYRSSVNLNSMENGGSTQQFMFETSGVLYDMALLDEILKRPELQNYKVYIFPHDTFISTKQKRQIAKLLKNKGRTIIWSYSTGYIDEYGKSVANMKELTGFDIKTIEEYDRKNAFSDRTNPLMKNVQELLSFGDLSISKLSPVSKNVWSIIGQAFWVEGAKNILARYADGKTAAAIKTYPNWTSIYFADHSSISNVFLNNVAKKVKAYRAGKAGHSIFMNGNFASIHPLYDDVYEFITPPGIKKVRNAFTGKLLGTAPKVKLNLKVGKTVWLFMLK